MSPSFSSRLVWGGLFCGLLYAYSWFLAPLAFSKAFVGMFYRELVEFSDAHNRGDSSEEIESAVAASEIRDELSWRGFLVRFDSARLFPSQHGPLGFATIWKWWLVICTLEGMTRFMWIAWLVVGIGVAGKRIVISPPMPPLKDELFLFWIRVALIPFFLTLCGLWLGPLLGQAVEWSTTAAKTSPSIWPTISVVLLFLVGFLVGIIWIFLRLVFGLVCVLIFSWWILPIHAICSYFYANTLDRI